MDIHDPSLDNLYFPYRCWNWLPTWWICWRSVLTPPGSVSLSSVTARLSPYNSESKWNYCSVVYINSTCYCKSGQEISSKFHNHLPITFSCLTKTAYLLQKQRQTITEANYPSFWLLSPMDEYCSRSTGRYSTSWTGNKIKSRTDSGLK